MIDPTYLDINIKLGSLYKFKTSIQRILDKDKDKDNDNVKGICWTSRRLCLRLCEAV